MQFTKYKEGETGYKEHLSACNKNWILQNNLLKLIIMQH